MMWRWILGFAIAAMALYGFYPVFNTASKPLLIVDMQNEDTLPRRFRVIEDLHASGSAQFSEESLKKILNALSKYPVTIMDLRQESHGFLDGIAVSWFEDRDWANKGKSLAEIKADEQNRLQGTLSQKFLLIYFSKKYPYPLYVDRASTEQSLASSLEIGYKRFPVQDHLKPSDEVVDDFVEFVKHMPKDGWLHFHCAAGEGRTTTFLAMYDMMRHSQNRSWEAILEKQNEAGGIDLLHATSTDDWKYPYAIERAQFLKKFYEYCKQNPQFQIPWSAWSNK